MNLREKMKIEQIKEKEKRKQKVIEASMKIVSNKGIPNTKLTDVAKEAEIGIASLYRYFGNKVELMIGTGEAYSKRVNSRFKREYMNESYHKLTGFQKAKSILNVFKILYKEHKGFICFMEEFDNYIISEGISRDKLQKYEGNILVLKEIMLCAIEEGKNDGTVKEGIDGEEFYITAAHMIMSLAQKLAIRGNILDEDDKISGEKQLEIAIDMATGYIENRE